MSSPSFLAIGKPQKDTQTESGHTTNWKRESYETTSHTILGVTPVQYGCRDVGARISARYLDRGFVRCAGTARQ